ncbi:MAG: EscU/YscU/HrcU family type III secretion system export apparatus switch protein [Spirochaetales bacterium]|nr:EscU/YscU/HrcU family type III secretion system export apparatus switch protein [Spirochaetales bacterium]
MGLRKSLALKWNREKDNAPRMIAAGKGPMAERIITLAREAGVPVEENSLLTEALIDTAPGSEIPPELYQLAAELYIFLMELDSEAAERTEAAERSEAPEA